MLLTITLGEIDLTIVNEETKVLTDIGGNLSALNPTTASPFFFFRIVKII